MNPKDLLRYRGRTAQGTHLFSAPGTIPLEDFDKRAVTAAQLRDFAADPATAPPRTLRDHNSVLAPIPPANRGKSKSTKGKLPGQGTLGL